MTKGADFLSFNEARKLAEKYGTPLYVLSRSKLIENYHLLKKYLPNVELYYAVKANSHPEVLKILATQGSKFDVASTSEIKALLNIGVSPSYMIHTHPIKRPSEIIQAIKLNVKTFVYDNIYELSKLLPYKDQISLILRISVENPESQVNLSAKFGADIKDAIPLIKKAHSMGFNIIGISFHSGSQNPNPYKIVEGIWFAREIFNYLYSEGIELQLLDIGGGFPITYIERVTPISAYTKPISEALELYFPNKKVIAEPGRFIVGNAIVLITSVIGKAKRHGITWYYIDDSLYHSFSGKVYDHCDYRLVPEKQGPPEQCTIAGGTCDSYDILYSDRALPPMEIGDLILVPGMGAYTSVSASHFNGFPPPRLVLID